MSNLSVPSGSPYSNCAEQSCVSRPVTTRSLIQQNEQIARSWKRAAVATVVQYDEWDEVLSHVTFSLNTHVSSATKVSPFEFAHGFKSWVPLTLGLTVDTPTTDELGNKEAESLAQQIVNRHHAASDQIVASQIRLGYLLERRSTPSAVAVHNKWRSQRCHLLLSEGTWRGVMFTNDVSRNQRSVKEG